MLVAFFAGKAYYEADLKIRKIFTMILNMTSNFSGIPLTFAFMILMGNTGILTLIGKEFNIAFLRDFNLYSGTGLVLIYIYFQIPLATLLLIPSFLGLKKEWSESSAILGAGKFQYWTKIGIPNLLPSILGTLSVLFANALAAYATAYALILNNYALLALQISSKFKGDVKIDKAMGGALAVVLIILMILATALNNYLIKRNTKGRALV
jgi:putative spermidine/putrescine transport system permease protein